MDPHPHGGDDKWKLTNKGRSRSGRPHAMAAASVLSRSYSSRPSSSSWQQQQAAASASGSSKSKSKSKNKCVKEAVKEHRARFYIVRRCVSMLVCWRDYY